MRKLPNYDPAEHTTRLQDLFMTRREMLQKTGMGMGALSLLMMLGERGLAYGATNTAGPTQGQTIPAIRSPLAPKKAPLPAKAKRVIHIWAPGGPSHVDTFDPKPALEKYADQTLPGANGGLPTVASPLGGGLQPLRAAAIRGLNTQIRGSLNSPDVTEYTVGAETRLGSRGLLRADLVYRDWGNFYAQRTDTSTGRISGQIGSAVQNFDLTLVENNDSLYKRTYEGLHTQFRYQASDKLDLGGNWTLSKTEGNFNAETQGNGPVPGTLGNYPEYFEARWASPKGSLSVDQRHRVNLYGVYRIFDHDHNSLSASLLQGFYSGHPYEEVGAISLINPATGANYVNNPGYLTAPTQVTYFFSKRGALTTPNVFRTDVSFNYDFRLGSVNLFLKPEVINVFNSQRVDTTDVRYFDTTILTAANSAACPQSPTGRCLPFNPFTEKPVEGVNFVKGANFGKPINALGYQQPRVYRVGLGLRF